MFIKMRNLLFSMLVGSLFAVASPADARALEESGQQSGPASGMLSRTVRIGRESYNYQLYVPANLRSKEKPPMIVFLHGIGQRGEGGFVRAEGGSGAVARQYLEQVPAIILLPQCRRNQYWHNPEMERMVMTAIDQTVAEFGADTKRLYLTGVSMGGYGAWHIASQHAGRFAALVSICGGSPLKTGDRFAPIARRVGRTPVWVFHGREDRIVPVNESRQMVEALQAIEGNRVRYTEIEGVGHNVWFNALAEPQLLPWILAQRLS